MSDRDHDSAHWPPDKAPAAWYAPTGTPAGDEIDELLREWELSANDVPREDPDGS